MVVMDVRDLLTEVGKFLTVTLAKERLSVDAEKARQQLIARLSFREGSPPQAYTDMNGSSYCNTKLQHQSSGCYEEFDSSFDANSKSPCMQHIPEGYINNLYNSVSFRNKGNSHCNNGYDKENYINIKHGNTFDDNMYINPTSPLANTPVNIQTKPPLPASNPPSNPNSERNSIISLKRDVPDRSSDSSSFSSSSTRCDESPEVLAMSASALRYAATKSGVLGRKERFLFMDHTKFYWVAILNQTLFVFSTDKDSKPLYELDITGYQARPVAIPCKNDKGDFKFELVSPGKKTYQFLAEKQTDMDKWVTALNAATRAIDSETPREWPRQLPSPPPLPQETYDQPDSAVRPVIEAEYELPDAVLRTSHLGSKSQLVKSNRYSHDLERRSCSPKEARSLPAPPAPPQQETYDQPEPTIRPVNGAASPELYESYKEELYHCIDDYDSRNPTQIPKDSARRLPLLPHELEMYDLPEPTIRPVTKPDTPVQEEFYSVIGNSSDHEVPAIQEAVYKNVDVNDQRIQEDESNYYNLVPSYPERETDQECIYDVITEQRQLCPSLNTQLSINCTTKPTVNIKSPVITSLKTDFKQKFEEKKLSPFVSNMATIFNKPFVKPQLREVKPPTVNKTCQ